MKKFIYRLKSGFSYIRANHIAKIVMIATMISMLIIWIFRAQFFRVGYETVSYAVISAAFPILCGLLFIAIMLIAGQAIDDYRYMIAFKRIGLKNSYGELPYLLHKRIYNNMLELTFASIGIPFEIWENNQAKIENALNMTISSIGMGDDMQTIIIRGIEGKNDMTEPIWWRNDYLTKDATIRLGESYGQPVYMDLRSYAHALIGGATGSGKTWLLQHMLYQCILKGYKVHIIDYKGGIDYPSNWKKYCTIADNDADVLKQLDAIITELEHRKVLFLESNCRNIEEYNQKAKKKLTRVVVACDELAEMLDTTGASKERKATIRQIEAYISSIARLGRAFGLNLLLATQRPDADVLGGQIKSNITYRICGRADDVLSRIILDNSDAADKIPKDAKGVFLTHDGTLFKGYAFDSATLYT